MTGAGEIQPIKMNLRKLGNAFTLWGRVSMWAKGILNVLALLLVVIAVLARFVGTTAPTPQTSTSGLPLPQDSVPPNTDVGIFFIICGVVLLTLSTFWSLRYVKWGKRLSNSSLDDAPSKSSTIDLLKIGLGVDLLGMVLTLIGGESIGGQLLIRSLFQFESVFNFRVGPLDLAPLLACVHLTFGLFFGISLSLYLLQRTTQPQS
ncbi:MAG: DUF3611 family protein [Cyanobacteria bacterium P01_F01_bin.42]